MKYSDVINAFYNQKIIKFNKGFDLFEQAYEKLKEKLNLTREEIEHSTWTEVIITNGKRRY